MSNQETNPPKVFISYSHDSPEHKDRVLELSDRLRYEGIDCIIDQYYEFSPPEGWPRWTEKQIREADFVLMVCTDTFCRRVMGEETPGLGRGARWEGNTIYQLLYNDGTSSSKFIPVLLENGKPGHIPTALQRTHYYCLNTEEGYEALYRKLTSQPSTPKNELGSRKDLPPRQRKQNFSASPSSDRVSEKRGRETSQQTRGCGDAETRRMEIPPHISFTQSDSKTKPKIGIITALPKEYAAVNKILENTKDISFPGQGAGRRYLLGEVPTSDEGKHTVVLCLASMGNNIAAIRASLLLNHFPDLESIIMVGIAGGVPHPEKPDDHVRLGDLVISNEKGVIQYDLVKETITEKIYRHPPRPPSASLIEGVRLLQANELMGDKPWLDFIDKALLPEGEQRPSIETDILVSSTEPKQIVKHPQDSKRRNGEPRVFIAPIASANDLLKNPLKRDLLRDNFGIKAVEMEGSGIADATWSYETGYLVVRGICDYCDSNKGDNWQAYAAAVAAAYTRTLLESIPAPKS
ncbi:MAG: TIR domain-containing protein [Symploca sp. SIO2E6]|nr:TIR domain-containing protein [Symploca sp. SIO2E6]